MPDPIFYARAQVPGDKRKVNGYVRSRFLMRNGAYVMDPVPAASQQEPLSSDRFGNNETNGKLANPNNYLIVPANYSEQETRDSGAALAETLRKKGFKPALEQMTSAFWPGGSEELQRNARWGIPPNSWVPAYTSAASDHFGYVTAAAGLPRELAELGGGIHNLYSKLRLSPVDTSGKFGLSKINEANIAQGYAAGLAAGDPPSPFNDYGYHGQPSVTPGQIGDGQGITPFPAGLVGIDPDEPVPPDWPPLQNSQVRYLASQRVRY